MLEGAAARLAVRERHWAFELGRARQWAQNIEKCAYCVAVVDRWAAKNPPPKYFRGGPREWAFFRMPISDFAVPSTEMSVDN